MSFLKESYLCQDLFFGISSVVHGNLLHNIVILYELDSRIGIPYQNQKMLFPVIRAAIVIYKKTRSSKSVWFIPLSSRLVFRTVQFSISTCVLLTQMHIMPNFWKCNSSHRKRTCVFHTLPKNAGVFHSQMQVTSILVRRFCVSTRYWGTGVSVSQWNMAWPPYKHCKFLACRTNNFFERVQKLRLRECNPTMQ